MRALLLAVLLVAACAQRAPTVAIAPGLTPRLDAAAAERLARDALLAAVIAEPRNDRAPDAISITGIRGGPTVGGYLPGKSWIVVFRGDFLTYEGFHPTRTGRHDGARVQISDDDGSVEAVDFTD